MNGPLPELPNSIVPTIAPNGETIRKVLIVAFTWAPQQRYQRVDPLESYKIQKPMIRNLSLCCNYINLHPELFVNGGLHYHATLHINDEIKWYKKVLPFF